VGGVPDLLYQQIVSVARRVKGMTRRSSWISQHKSGYPSNRYPTPRTLTKCRGAVRTVWVEGRVNHRQVAISVRDRGMGMPSVLITAKICGSLGFA
jgi:hypothetical protein